MCEDEPVCQRGGTGLRVGHLTCHLNKSQVRTIILEEVLQLISEVKLHIFKPSKSHFNFIGWNKFYFHIFVSVFLKK